jgi:hypothetical protein
MLLTNKTNEVKMILILVLFNFGCNNSSLNNRMDDSDYFKENTSTANSPINESKGVKVKEEVIYDGVYVGSQLVSEGYELKAELIVNGDKWTAKSQMSYDNELAYDSPEYANGIVRGKRLYDESGMIEIGYDTGKSASINGYPVMTK